MKTFAFRPHAAAALQYVVAPGETLEPGDLIMLDRKTGMVRKAYSDETGQKFTVPPGSRINEQGYLEMPR